jgi:hypothetical protein
MDRKDCGAHFEISVDGKPRSYRDQREIAIEAGKYLKERHPTNEIIVRDLRDNSQTVIGWEKGVASIRV